MTCTIPDSVAPLASKGYWLPGLPATCLPDGWVGGAVVTSDTNIVAIGRPHIGAQVTTYDGFTSGSLSSYLPMLFKDAYGGSYDSAFYIQNTEASAANVTTKFYDSTWRFDLHTQRYPACLFHSEPVAAKPHLWTIV